MENATKALIIAAAILIAIVLISLGVFVLGQGTEMVKENSDMSPMQISAYNSKFESYLGEKVSGSKAKQLITTIEQHNRSNDSTQQVGFEGEINSASKINMGNTYKITVPSNGGYSKSGLIVKVKIEVAS